MGGIFNDGQVMINRHLLQRIQVARMPVQMHSNDGFYASPKFPFGTSDSRFQPGRVQAERTGLHIGEYGPGSHVFNHVHAGTERKRRSNDAVARPDTKRQQREMQRGRAGAHSQRILRPDE